MKLLWALYIVLATSGATGMSGATDAVEMTISATEAECGKNADRLQAKLDERKIKAALSCLPGLRVAK